MAYLELSFFNTLDVSAQGKRIASFRSAKVAGLLVYLVLEARTTHERDKLAAYSKHVAGYLVKSDTADQFSQVISMLGQYVSTVHFCRQLHRRRIVVHRRGLGNRIVLSMLCRRRDHGAFVVASIAGPRKGGGGPWRG